VWKTIFHGVEKSGKSFPWLWKNRDNVFHGVENGKGRMSWTTKAMAAGLAVAMLAGPGFAVPAVQHDPVPVAEKGKPMGVRATVRDAGARVESVSLFYAASRGTTPFRVAMSSTGAGMWYGTVPGHMVGPGSQLLYYIQAENADGETRETDWHTVKVVESGIAPEAIPAASEVARQAQRQAAPAAPAASAPPPAPERPGRSKYLIPGAIIVGGAVAVGGALAIADNNSGGGGGGGSAAITNANYGGNYSFCFEPTSESNTTTVCDSGLVNVYVRDGNAEVVGLWGAEIFRSPLNGSLFTVSKTVPATAKFPESYLIVSGEVRGESCSATVNGYSRDAANPGNYAGQINTTKR
jgi:hypothetical protein